MKQLKGQENKRKPVCEISWEETDEFEYYATGNTKDTRILASDSLENLKEAIKYDTRWMIVLIAARTGCLSVGHSHCAEQIVWIPKRYG